MRTPPNLGFYCLPNKIVVPLIWFAEEVLERVQSLVTVGPFQIGHIDRVMPRLRTNRACRSAAQSRPVVEGRALNRAFDTSHETTPSRLDQLC